MAPLLSFTSNWPVAMGSLLEAPWVGEALNCSVMVLVSSNTWPLQVGSPSRAWRLNLQHIFHAPTPATGLVLCLLHHFLSASHFAKLVLSVALYLPLVFLPTPNDTRRTVRIAMSWFPIDETRFVVYVSEEFHCCAEFPVVNRSLFRLTGKKRW